MFGWLRSKSASKDVALMKSDAAPGKLTLGQVFVPGGKPTITYVPRSKLGLEDTVRDHIRETREILLLIGPTKSGKTAPTAKVAAEVRAAWTGRAVVWSEMPSSSRA